MKIIISLLKARPAPRSFAICGCLWLLSNQLAAATVPALDSASYSFTTLTRNEYATPPTGSGNAGWFSSVEGVAVDRRGNVYLASAHDHTLSRMTPAGVLTILAGKAGCDGSADGTGSNARFFHPRGVAVDGAGNVYVADTHNHTIRRVTPTGRVSTLAGQPEMWGCADGTGSEARFCFPTSVAVDVAHNCYVADALNHTIRKVTPQGVVTTLAGRAGDRGSADGKGRAARFDFPTGLAVDGSGNVYVADELNNLIRKLTPNGVVTTLSGHTTDNVSDGDGIGISAQFYHPSGLAVDRTGNIYVADHGGCTIRRIAPNGEVATLGGLALHFGSADGIGGAARFDSPLGVSVDRFGNVYVADSGNGTIRKGVPEALAEGPGLSVAAQLGVK